MQKKKVQSTCNENPHPDAEPSVDSMKIVFTKPNLTIEELHIISLVNTVETSILLIESSIIILLTPIAAETTVPVWLNLKQSVK